MKKEIEKIIEYINTNICAVGIKQEQELKSLLTPKLPSDDDLIRIISKKKWSARSGEIMYSQSDVFDCLKELRKIYYPAGKVSETVTCECGNIEPLDNMRSDEDGLHTCDKCYISFLEDKLSTHSINESKETATYDRCYQLAKFMHEEYELIAKEKEWNTQEGCKVGFKDLPVKNKETMIALSGKILNSYFSSNKLVGKGEAVEFGEFLKKYHSLKWVNDLTTQEVYMQVFKSKSPNTNDKNK